MEQQTPRETLARNIRIRRAELRITQEELAIRVGISQSYLSGVELAKRNVSIDHIYRIATALEIDTVNLLNPSYPHL